MQRLLFTSLKRINFKPIPLIQSSFIRFRSTMKTSKVKTIEPNAVKSVALNTALKQIEAQFGKGAVMKLGDREHLEIPVISTGSLTVDKALGIYGLPRGRIVEIYGPESSGKTSLALMTVAQAQKTGGLCTFIDAEHALDPSYAEKLGVNIKDLYISQPDSGEQALEICDSLVRSGTMDVIVVDSVAALVPKAEVEGSMGDQHMALQARLMSQALRKLTGSISKSNTVLIFINQIRSKVGVLFGSPEVTPGGNALKFYCSIRMDIRRKTQIKQGDEIIGYETTVKVVKNKCSPPFKVASFNMLFGEGIDKYGEIFDIAVQEGLIKKSGSWFSYQGENLSQGRPQGIKYLKENPDFYNTLMQAIKTQWATPVTSTDTNINNKGDKNDEDSVSEEFLPETTDPDNSESSDKQ
ncbi:hypothetical protein WA158_002303 [Blastocystis sp. Blastoise]